MASNDIGAELTYLFDMTFVSNLSHWSTLSLNNIPIVISQLIPFIQEYVVLVLPGYKKPFSSTCTLSIISL